MKLWDIVKTVGAGAFSTMVPGGAAILATVNSLLPEDKKLPENASGSDIQSTISTLPPEQQAQLMDKEYDVQITEIKESHSTARTMLEAEAKSTHTTRPKIALGAFYLVAILSSLIVIAWLYAVVVVKDEKLVKAIVDGWPWVTALLLPFVGWLDRYFGILKQEQKNRLDAVSGNNKPTGIAGLISTLVKK
jgi:hypothetical protein